MSKIAFKSTITVTYTVTSVGQNTNDGGGCY